MTTATEHPPESEVNILARILSNECGELPDELARYLLSLKISERDKARMQDLAGRNQEDGLTPAENVEMLAFGKATTLLSILKSRARRKLGLKLETWMES